MHGKLALGALKGQFCFLGRSVCIGGRTPTQGAHPSAGAALGARNGQLPLRSQPKSNSYTTSWRGRWAMEVALS